MNYPKTVKIKVPYEFIIANESAYDFLKRKFGVTNLKDLQNEVSSGLEQLLTSNEKTYWDSVNRKEEEIEEPVHVRPQKKGLPWE